ncbi:MAG: T9SS type A sorting domain-containing protein, partial [Bacteroidales bacterium]|nr:T9SS type A sorting domain-containing protein [Bacteroidales bacterium]
NVSISFCDLYGKILTENTIQSCNGAAICNVANLPKGLYIVKISANNSVYYQKLIIE